MSYGALGLVEVLGSCNAVVVLDSRDFSTIRRNIAAGGRRGRETS